jgi:putative ABC transport system substrate-binding protein
LRYALEAVTLLTDLDAFYVDHRRCGALEAGVDGPVVWFDCECGARIPDVLTTLTYLTSTVESPHHPGMDRRRFLLTSLAGVFSAPLVVEAQRAARSRPIGYLSSNSASRTQHLVAAFRQGLRELGYVEGQNINIEYRFAEGKFERLPAFAAELVELNLDVIVATPTNAALAAKSSTATIPIVMVNAGDPVGVGLVASLARPGGNATGLSYSPGLEIVGKGLELFKQAIPNVRLVAVLWNPDNKASALGLRDLKAAARSYGIKLQFIEAREPNELDAAFVTIRNARLEALLVVADTMFIVHRARLADLAVKNRLPSMHGVRENVEAGGLMSYGPNSVANYRRAAAFVDKILKGAKPADLPVEQPTTVELVLNLKTAKALGLTIPPSLLARADQVIE